MGKKVLRQEIRNRKGRFSQQQLREMSLLICDRIKNHPLVISATTILLYHSLPDEVHTHQLIEQMVQAGKRVILPKVISDTEMTLHTYASQTDMREGSYGIMEPCTPSIQPSLINREDTVAIVPGMAFDAAGHRLGRGKGYYDRMMVQLPCIYKIGVCYPFQLLPEVPSDSHDIVMDEILS